MAILTGGKMMRRYRPNVQAAARLKRRLTYEALTHLRGRASTPAAFVLDHGRWFRPPRGAGGGVRGGGPLSVLRAVLGADHLGYAEGYAVTRGGTVLPHAWGVDRLGR